MKFKKLSTALLAVLFITSASSSTAFGAELPYIAGSTEEQMNALYSMAPEVKTNFCDKVTQFVSPYMPGYKVLAIALGLGYVVLGARSLALEWKKKTKEDNRLINLFIGNLVLLKRNPSLLLNANVGPQLLKDADQIKSHTSLKSSTQSFLHEFSLKPHYYLSSINSCEFNKKVGELEEILRPKSYLEQILSKLLFI
ncbi:MAG: hypothetical protein AB7R69_02870 [Candidatus Babeliales bacterium]